MKSNPESSCSLKDDDDPITGVIGDFGKYQLLICALIAFFEVGKVSKFTYKANSDSIGFYCSS